MKVKKIIFITLLLAAASLGLARQYDQTIQDLVRLGFPRRPIRELNPVLGGPMSSQCQNALFHVFTSPEFFKCVPIGAILPLAPLFPFISDTGFTEKVKSDPDKNVKPLIGPLVQFSIALCDASKCNDKEVADTIEVIKDGCETEFSDNPALQSVFDFTVLFPLIRDTVCFDDGRPHQFCWEQTILTILSLPPSPLNVTGDPTIDSIAVADPDEICTTCNKKLISNFFNFINNNDLAVQTLENLGLVIDTIRDAVAIKCGGAFLSF